jgi:hypothetical protein
MTAAKMKILPENVIASLTDIFNVIKESQKIPEQWYDCNVIAIQKCGRSDELAENKRPISIYSLNRRIFEKIMLRRLIWWLENNKILSPTQYGFRKGKGCQDCVALLVLEIKLAFQRKEMLVAVFLDIKAAFDNVNVREIIVKLNECGMPIEWCKLIWNLMKKRRNHFMIDNRISEINTCYSRLSQGLSLPPTLFNVDICDIGNQMEFPV